MKQLRGEQSCGKLACWYRGPDMGVEDTMGAGRGIARMETLQGLIGTCPRSESISVSAMMTYGEFVIYRPEQKIAQVAPRDI